jgi:TPR repeat protein
MKQKEFLDQCNWEAAYKVPGAIEDDIYFDYKFTPQQMDQLRQDAEKGDKWALYLLGYLTPNMDFISRAAELNCIPAVIRLARISKARSDLFRAFEYWLQAAELGSRDAMCELALCYARGYGTKQDFVTAQEWGSRGEPDLSAQEIKLRYGI